MHERAKWVQGAVSLCVALAPVAASANSPDGAGAAPATPVTETRSAAEAERGATEPAALARGSDREHGLAWAIDVGMGQLSMGQYEILGGAMRLYLGVGFNMPESKEAPVARGSLGYQALGLADRTAVLHRHQLATTLHWWRFNIGVGGGASVLNAFGTEGFESDTAVGGSFTVWLAGQLAGSAGFHALAPLTVDVLRVGGERVVMLEIGVQLGFQRF